MAIDTLLPDIALVLVDLQVGITALPTIHPAGEVVDQAARLASAFRARRLPVALVRVAFSADGGDLVRTRTDAPPPPMSTAPDFSRLREELGSGEHDILVTKRGWDAFNGTELDLQLRRRGVRSIVIGGIRTGIGVESTARTAFGHGYEVVFASDAITDIDQGLHDRAFQAIFPRLGRSATTDAILAALDARGA